MAAMRLPPAVCFLLLAALGVPLAGGGAARADDPPDAAPDDAAARAKRSVEEAKKAKEEADRAFAARVDAAVEKGAKWLEGRQQGNGSWPGMQGRLLDVQDLGLNALCVLALSKCGRGSGTSVIQRGLRRLREMYDGKPSRGLDFEGTHQLKTYSVATYVMALEAVYGPPPAPPTPGKPGDTKERKPAKEGPPPLPGEADALVRRLVAWIVKHQTDEVWRYPGGALGTLQDKDLSNTQYAMLALETAAHRGIAVPPAVFEKTLPYLLVAQAPDGPEVVRWARNEGYVPGLVEQGEEGRYGPFVPGPKDKARGWSYLASLNVFSGSMTCAGLACLAIAKDRLKAAGRLDKERERQVDRAMLDGMAWLSANFTVATNPGVGDGGWHYYYLYGLERAGALLGQECFGQHDWYREGAEFLLTAQTADGSWPEAQARDLNAKLQQRVVQTCFALLFLRRATVRPAQPVGPVTTGD